MLRNEQREELQTAMRQTKDKRLFERYQTVFLHLEGKITLKLRRSFNAIEQRLVNILKPIKKKA